MTDGTSGQAHGADSSGTAVPAAIVQQAEAATALGDTGVAVELAAAGMGVQPEPHAHKQQSTPTLAPLPLPSLAPLGHVAPLHGAMAVGVASALLLT